MDQPTRIISSASLYLGDCLAILRGMDSKSVDCVITDPPYGVDLAYDSCEDSFDQWKSLIDSFLPEATRVSRGPVVVPTSKLEGERHLYSLGPLWRVCWFKGASDARSPVGFKDWETSFIFGSKPRKQIHDHFYENASNIRKQVTWHPCPKPIAWADWFVSRFAKEGDLVVDPFMGSGTVGVSCLKHGVRFIGIDLSPAYFDGACKRITEEAARSDFLGGSGLLGGAQKSIGFPSAMEVV